MPSSTWRRLPQEKRDRIERAFRQEFAEHSYSDASLNRVCKVTGVAKGSIFQYFTNKLDIWHTITRDAAERAFQAGVGASGSDDMDLFDRLERYSLALVRHLRDNPIDRKLVAATIDTGERSARELIRQSTNEMYAHYVGPMVYVAVERGELDSDSADELLTLVILLLRFLANAPFTPDRDPVLDLYRQPWPEIEARTVALVRRLEAAFRPLPVNQ